MLPLSFSVKESRFNPTESKVPPSPYLGLVLALESQSMCQMGPWRPLSQPLFLLLIHWLLLIKGPVAQKGETICWGHRELKVGSGACIFSLQVLRTPFQDFSQHLLCVSYAQTYWKGPLVLILQ